VVSQNTKRSVDRKPKSGLLREPVTPCYNAAQANKNRPLQPGSSGAIGLGMIEVYLPGTEERQFTVWLQAYCDQKSLANTSYEFSKGWSYKLSFPVLEDETSARFTARVYRPFPRYAAMETTETMANNLEAIKLEWVEVGDRLKVTISPHEGSWVMPPLNDLLASIRASWPEAISDRWM